jgi:hypothetical protein
VVIAVLPLPYRNLSSSWSGSAAKLRNLIASHIPSLQVFQTLQAWMRCQAGKWTRLRTSIFILDLALGFVGQFDQIPAQPGQIKNFRASLESLKTSCWPLVSTEPCPCRRILAAGIMLKRWWDGTLTNEVVGSLQERIIRASETQDPGEGS